VEDIPLDSTDAVALALCHAQKALHPEYGLLGKTL
jgi:Holliday junction resolvasome RuvABC endonuclease subunit